MRQQLSGEPDHWRHVAMNCPMRGISWLRSSSQGKPWLLDQNAHVSIAYPAGLALDDLGPSLAGSIAMISPRRLTLALPVHA